MEEVLSVQAFKPNLGQASVKTHILLVLSVDASGIPCAEKEAFQNSRDIATL